MKKIIVIDDELEVAEIIKANLPADKYECITALDGDEGLEKVESEKPDLVILDLLMPKKSGYEVCSELKTNSKTAKIPVILLTKKKEHRDKYIGTVFLKADEYIAKPFDVPGLLKKIEKLIG
ncbi:MAG TPA: two-component system response regulator [Elusimicrobia bacterium]|nr:two-component system response regulator [Elusimicrobiota bacterium]